MAHEVEERIKYLECCLASNSTVAKPKLEEFHEFNRKLTQITGETLEASYEKSIKGTKELINLLESVKRNIERGNKVCKQVEIRLENCTDSSEFHRLHDKFSGFIDRLFQRIAKIHDLMAKIVDSRWDYLPSELQEILESVSRKLFLRGASEGYTSQELTASVQNFVTSVFRAAENGKSNPKLWLLDAHQNLASNEFDVETDPHPSFADAMIRDLTQELADFPGAKQVKAVADIPGDLHRVTFLLQVSTEINEEFDPIGELWEKAERMAHQLHRQLRKSTGEKWYFFVEVVRDFSSYAGNPKIIASAHHARSSRK